MFKKEGQEIIIVDTSGRCVPARGFNECNRRVCARMTAGWAAGTSRKRRSSRRCSKSPPPSAPTMSFSSSTGTRPISPTRPCCTHPRPPSHTRGRGAARPAALGDPARREARRRWRRRGSEGQGPGLAARYGARRFSSATRGSAGGACRQAYTQRGGAAGRGGRGGYGWGGEVWVLPLHCTWSPAVPDCVRGAALSGRRRTTRRRRLRTRSASAPSS